MQFTFDTSGVVEGPITAPDGQRFDAVGWAFLSPFAQGFAGEAIEQMNRIMADLAIYYPTDRAPKRLAFSDLSPAALALILRDCEAHQKVYGLPAGDPRERARGEWFWKNRQAGMWAKEGFPPLRLFLSDEGKIGLEAADA